jgi:hypothetical protein
MRKRKFTAAQRTGIVEEHTKGKSVEQILPRSPDQCCHINAGWAMDFLSEWVVREQGQSVRIINIVDECSRRALWTEAHASITGATLTDILDKVVKWRGKPV